MFICASVPNKDCAHLIVNNHFSTIYLLLVYGFVA